MPSGRNGTPTTPDLSGVDVSSLRILTIEDILSANDVKKQTIAVPEWGGAVVIESLTKAKEFMVREAAGGAQNLDSELFEMLLFVYGVIEPQFQPEQVELLKKKSSAPFDRVLKAVMELSGLTEEAKEKKKSGFPETA